MLNRWKIPKNNDIILVKGQKEVMKKFKKVMIIIILCLIFLSSYFIYNGYIMYKNALNKVLVEEKVDIIKSKDNYTKIKDISDTYKKAVIASEDHRFYKHGGIDIISILRAFLIDIKTFSFKEGGSTITQQLSKNIYFTQDKKIERKIAEIFMARDIESKYSKDEILELYLNTLYYGNGYYSIKEASLGYFNKLPSNLSDIESVSLAGIFSAPSYYNPKYDINNKRKKMVISKMVKYGYIDKNKAEQLLKN